MATLAQDWWYLSFATNVSLSCKQLPLTLNLWRYITHQSFSSYRCLRFMVSSEMSIVREFLYNAHNDFHSTLLELKSQNLVSRRCISIISYFFHRVLRTMNKGGLLWAIPSIYVLFKRFLCYLTTCPSYLHVHLLKDIENCFATIWSKYVVIWHRTKPI